jgi:hypothetical protein
MVSPPGLPASRAELIVREIDKLRRELSGG